VIDSEAVREHTRYVLARLPLVVFVLLWSSGYVVGALGVEVATPLALLTVRFAIALVLAVPLALRVPGWREAPFGRLAVVGLLLQGVQFAGVYGGLSLGVPAEISALVVLGLAPVATTALVALSGMERPTGRIWALLALGVAGVALSVAPDLGGAQVGAGVGLTVLGMLGLAGGTVLQKRWVGEADPRVAVATQIVAATAVLVPVAVVTGQLQVDPWVQLGWTVAWLAWPLSIGATILFVRLLARYAASTTSTLLLVVPAVTAVESALVLGERLHPLSLVGMALTVAAVAAVVREPDRPAAPVSAASTR